MDGIVEAFVQGISVGEAKDVNGFTMFALMPVQEGTLRYGTLKDAIASRSVKVREVDASGSVGDLKVTNIGIMPVLALDGEELAGAKQNRILNTTVLLAEGSETTIPVSCTEQGRWAYTSYEFGASTSFAPPSIRENAKRAVNKSLEENRGFRANQGEVWDHVTRIARERGVDSPTNAMADVVKSRMPDLDRTLASIPVVEGQCGLLAVADGRVLGMDIISRPEAYFHLHERLVRSYVLEAPRTSSSIRTASPERATAEFLNAVTKAAEQRFKSVALGWDLRYSGNGIVGSALVHENEVIHVAFFHVPAERAFLREPEIRSYRTRMDYRRTGTPREDHTVTGD